ncbi:small subunit ribosomal protein S15 [Mycoplasma testudineum]|uniref:Small ribosomal subunit protein uS15 n=1 Tax=Mycoplasma testudineum TaxID=244584 RepID=A0A4R6IFJ8_9MOLU|nr:30S ribosomal protein S15 [Mycoplasma testudineum]OYD26919.1 30S ribosomal protein S15 [Mycoplasma testudineum]TDO20468.1 small subunit ribosomal protein S15 [Mycoplasma testudineum]
MKIKEEMLKVVSEFGGSEKNTGSTEVQIAILTHDIERLKVHFQVNKKDKHSMRGFLAKIAKRKKLLSYLQKNNYDSYLNLISKLGIRK